MSDCFQHPQALCESRNIGAGTRVWAFVHILPGAVIGNDCNICDHVFIENDVVLGDRVTVKCGVQLWDGLRVASDVFIGPNATFTNDKFPRSKSYQSELPRTLIEKGASIGANATILPGITIGARAMVGAGAVVTHSVPPRAIVAGNPARIVGYVDTPRRAASQQLSLTKPEGDVVELSVQGATLHQLKEVRDLRGGLAVGDFPKVIPFVPKRFFLVYDVPNSKVRGEHAHRACHQFLICVSGSLAIIVDDGQASEEVALDHPGLGVYIPPMTWSVQYKYAPGTVLLVFASHQYDASDYIRDYDEFLSAKSQVSGAPDTRCSA